MSKKFRLLTLKLDEVSLVDRPANPLATVTIFKRDNQETSMTPEQIKALQDENTALKAAAQKSSEEVTFLKDSLKTVTAKADKLEAEVAKKDPTEEDKLKSLPVAVRKDIEDLKKANADAQAELAKVRDDSMSSVYLAKASSLRGLAQKPEEFGPVLKRIATNKATPEDILKLETVLTAASTAAEKGITQEHGDNRPAGDDLSKAAADKLDTIAKQISADEKVNYFTAYAKATERNPGLYKDYLAARQ